MDDVDRKILAELQADGRLTLTELADRVRLSVSPCHRRLRTLERSGAIAGYHAQLDASVLGLTFEALVFVTMRYADRQTVAAFEEHAKKGAGAFAWKGQMMDQPHLTRAKKIADRARRAGVI